MKIANKLNQIGTFLGTPLMWGKGLVERQVFARLEGWAGWAGGRVGNSFMDYYLNLKPLSDVTVITPQRKFILDINCVMLGVALCIFGFAFYINTLP